MTIMQSMRWASAIALATATTAAAGTLKVVQVAAPDVLCTFEPNCRETSADSATRIPLNYSAGSPFLQSRVFTAAAGTPGAGTTAYEYRVDLTSAAGAVDCLLGLVINFGPIKQLPYVAGAMADVFVVSKGGIGAIGIKSAEQDGDVITFEFDKPMCIETKAGAGQSTFLFGLASTKPPQDVDAGMFGYGTPAFISLPARAPAH